MNSFEITCLSLETTCLGLETTICLDLETTKNFYLIEKRVVFYIFEF